MTASAPTSAHQPAPAHLLLVDDDRLILATLSSGLQEMGYQVSAAESVDDAEALLTSGLRPDLAIVDATLGDACSNVTDVDNPIGSFALGLTVRPNPARDFAIVRLGVSTATESTPGLVRIVDASGRLVRSFPAEGAQSGGGIRWDLSDSSGRPLPAGIYFAVAHRSEDELRAPILIVR